MFYWKIFLLYTVFNSNPILFFSSQHLTFYSLHAVGPMKLWFRRTTFKQSNVYLMSLYFLHCEFNPNVGYLPFIGNSNISALFLERNITIHCIRFWVAPLVYSFLEKFIENGFLSVNSKKKYLRAEDIVNLKRLI